MTIDYTKQSVPDAALASPLAPFAVVVDCVGGTEVVQLIDRLILHDPRAPELGIFVTIVGDSEYGGLTSLVSRHKIDAIAHSAETGRDKGGGAITNVRPSYLQPPIAHAGLFCTDLATAC